MTTTKTATAHLIGVSPYSPSRAHSAPKEPRETADAYEQRTWREKAHYDDKTREAFIPAMSFKMALDSAAQMLGLKIPGKGNSTYSKFFKSGVLVLEPAMLGVKVDDMRGIRIHANADGKRGGNKRVWRTFPTVDEWSATVVFHVLAPEITEDIFRDHLVQAGSFVGVGRYRPQNGGTNGRFSLGKLEWS